MFYEENFEKIQKKFLECMNNVFADAKGDSSIYDNSEETYLDGEEGVSLCFDGFNFRGVELTGFANFEEGSVFASLFVDNNLDAKKKEELIKEWSKSEIAKTWDIEQNLEDIMLTFDCVGNDIDDLFCRLEKAYSALVENFDTVKSLQVKEVKVLNLSKLPFTWRDARDKIELYNTKFGKDNRLEVTKKGEVKLYLEDKKVQIDTTKLQMVVGAAPKMFKSGYIMFHYEDIENSPDPVSISKDFKKDYEIVKELFQEAFAPFGIAIGME